MTQEKFKELQKVSKAPSCLKLTKSDLKYLRYRSFIYDEIVKAFAVPKSLL